MGYWINFYSATGWRRLFVRYQHCDLLNDGGARFGVTPFGFYTSRRQRHADASFSVEIHEQRLMAEVESGRFRSRFFHRLGRSACNVLAATFPRRNNCATAIGRALGFTARTPDQLIAHLRRRG